MIRREPDSRLVELHNDDYLPALGRWLAGGIGNCTQIIKKHMKEINRPLARFY